jgi:hypothetical protein
LAIPTANRNKLLPNQRILVSRREANDIDVVKAPRSLIDGPKDLAIRPRGTPSRDIAINAAPTFQPRQTTTEAAVSRPTVAYLDKRSTFERGNRFTGDSAATYNHNHATGPSRFNTTAPVFPQSQRVVQPQVPSRRQAEVLRPHLFTQHGDQRQRTNIHHVPRRGYVHSDKPSHQHKSIPTNSVASSGRFPATVRQDIVPPVNALKTKTFDVPRDNTRFTRKNPLRVGTNFTDPASRMNTFAAGDHSIRRERMQPTPVIPANRAKGATRDLVPIGDTQVRNRQNHLFSRQPIRIGPNRNTRTHGNDSRLYARN